MPTDPNKRYCKTPGCDNLFIRRPNSNRLYCFDCAPDRSKQPNIFDFPQNGPKSAKNDENAENEGPMTRTSREHLEKLRVTGTWQAEAVLTLARQIDAGKGGGSAGVAGAIRAHRDAMAVAEAISTVDDADVIDLLFRENDA